MVAGKGAEFAASTPGSYALTGYAGSKWASYIFTDRPVYRPSHTVHWKAILRVRDGNALAVPPPQNVHVTIVDQEEKPLRSQHADEPRGIRHGRLRPAKGRFARLLQHPRGRWRQRRSGDFHVEEYRKPEYRVQVTAAQKRVLQGRDDAGHHRLALFLRRAGRER